MKCTIKTKLFASFAFFVTLLSTCGLLSQPAISLRLDAASETETFRGEAELLNFNIGENWKYFYSTGGQSTGAMGVRSGTIEGGYYRIFDVMVQHANLNGYFAYFYRIEMTPDSSKHSLNGWCHTSIDMKYSYQEILSFAPQNNPTSTIKNGAISIGTSGIDISFPADIQHSDLTIESLTDTPSHYETKYTYYNSILPYDWYSTYLKHTVFNYGSLIFYTKASPASAFITIEHHIGFNEAVAWGFGEASHHGTSHSYTYGK